jgi:hypothetical protein
VDFCEAASEAGGEFYRLAKYSLLAIFMVPELAASFSSSRSWQSVAETNLEAGWIELRKKRNIKDPFLC